MKHETINWGGYARMVSNDVVIAPGQRIKMNVFSVENVLKDGGKPPSLGGPVGSPASSDNIKSTNQKLKHFEGSRYSEVKGIASFENSSESIPQSATTAENVEQMCREIVPRIPRGTAGFIFMEDGQPVAADFFGSEELAINLLPELLQSYVSNHVIGPGMLPACEQERNDLSAIEFFRRVCTAGSETTYTPGSGEGIRTHERDIVGDGVIYDGRIVHYGARVELIGTSYLEPPPAIIWPRGEIYHQRQ